MDLYTLMAPSSSPDSCSSRADCKSCCIESTVRSLRCHEGLGVDSPRLVPEEILGHCTIHHEGPPRSGSGVGVVSSFLPAPVRYGHPTAQAGQPKLRRSDRLHPHRINRWCLTAAERPAPFRTRPTRTFDVEAPGPCDETGWWRQCRRSSAPDFATLGPFPSPRDTTGYRESVLSQSLIAGGRGRRAHP